MTESPPESSARLNDDLVVAARTDRESLGRLFDLYYPSIWNFCVRRVGDRATAEDVTSDVFLKIAVGMSRFAGTTEDDFRRWIFRIAINELNAVWRQSRRRKSLLVTAVREGRVRGSEVEESSHDCVSEQDWPIVQRELSSLPQRDRDVISLRYFLGFSDRQIAGIVEIPENQVRVVLNRAVDKLRKRLGVETKNENSPGTQVSPNP